MVGWCCFAYQWLQFLSPKQVELGHEIYKMLVARVHMSLCAKLRDSVEMMNVHVNEYSEEAVQ